MMSFEMAFDLLEHAEQGNPIDQFNLGLMYESGDLVPVGYTEAMYWYRKAAEQGLPEAQFNLGNMYFPDDQGIPHDFVQAHLWFSLAADQDYENAGNRRNEVASRMTRDQIFEAQRLARDWKQQHCQCLSGLDLRAEWARY